MQIRPAFLSAATVVLCGLACSATTFAQAARTAEEEVISTMVAYRMAGSYPPACVAATLAPPLDGERRSWNGWHDERHRRPVHYDWLGAPPTPGAHTVTADPELVARLDRLLTVGLDGPARPAGPPISPALLPNGLRLSSDGRNCQSVFLSTPFLIEDLAFIEVGDAGGILWVLQRRGDRWQPIALVGIWIS